MSSACAGMMRSQKAVNHQRRQALPSASSSAAPTPVRRRQLLVGDRSTRNVAAGDGAGILSVGLGITASVGGYALFQVATDPENRRKRMAEESGGSELKSVEAYFEGEGFQRWRRIYDDEADDVNKVQKDIREGHAQTIDKAIRWMSADGVDGVTVCDAGCGTGSLTIPLALQGADVYASDISSNMVKEAGSRFSEAVKMEGGAKAKQPTFEAKDLESIQGSFDVVTCLDVVIHYPDEKLAGMLEHLSSLATKRLVISFAPKTPYYSFLKRVGELFPGPSKATRAYLHSEEEIEAALGRLGWKVARRDMTATSFYFSKILDLQRA